MEDKLYILLLFYFLFGALAFFAINRKKPPVTRKNHWLKFYTYFVVINLLFFSIWSKFLPFLIGIIIIGGYFELIRLTVKTRKFRTGFLSLLIFSAGFYSLALSSFLESRYLYFLLFIVTVFDAFSQISGQYLGKRKLIPSISPNKTIEGLTGGIVCAVLTGLIIREIVKLNLFLSVIWSLSIAVFALSGDLIASSFKRKYGVKDFSQLIPGHGGVLDRFDSLIFGSLSIHLLIYFFA